MVRFPCSRRLVIGMGLGFAVACMTLPALADSPITVAFQANNPWTQEIGSVSNRDSSHDYSVAVAAGKTFQINLVTRDPNVFFKVENQTEGKQLVDTYKTGATTWSTSTPTAATYTIHVYVQPDAMQRGEVAKYALQIGQYGAADMQPATTTVNFQDNNPWVQEVSSLDSAATAHDYTVAIAAGKTLQVNLITRDSNLHFKVENQTNDSTLVDTGSTAGTTWTTPVAAPTTYTIRVYTDPAAMPPGHQAQYALQIGQYASQGAQPATPAAAGTAAPQAPTAGAVPAPASTR